MSEHIVQITRPDEGDMGLPGNLSVTMADDNVGQPLTQADTDAVSQLINDPEFQRAVQEQVQASASGETVYVQVTTGSGEQASIPTSIIINKNVPQDVIQKKIHTVTGTQPQQQLRHDNRRQRPVNVTSLPDVNPSVPMSTKCVCCNSTNKPTLRNIKSNSMLLELFSGILSPAFPVSEERFRICDQCIATLDKMKEMRDNMRANFKHVDSRFELQPVPLTKTKFREDLSLKRVRTDDNDDDHRTGEHEYHRSESTYNRSKKAIEISGLLTKQYLNIAPFTDEERLSIAGIINVAAPTELAAKIMKVPALLNAIKKLILLETNHTCEKLCSSTQLPGPSVLRLKGVNTISEDDLISEIIVEMRRCMPFVMDLLFTICRPLHAPRVECREIMAIIYAMGMYCRSPALTAVRRINVNKILASRNLRQRIINAK